MSRYVSPIKEEEGVSVVDEENSRYL
jgi:hypothetical protein